VVLPPRVWGYAVWPMEQRVAAVRSTLFDLASLTKVVGTASACFALVDAGELRLGTRVGEILPAFAGPVEGEDPDWRRQVTLRHLLTHTSGLPAGRSLREIPGGRRERLEAVCRTPLAQAPGERVVYSDLGFMLLGEALAQVSGQELPELCRQRLFEPLGMRRTGWNPPPGLREEAAATEWVEAGLPPDGRGGYLRGIVHDENARALDGVAGHAGLFSTVDDLSVFAEMLRGRGTLATEHGPVRVLSAAAVDRMATAVVLQDGDGRSLGWQTSGRLWSPYGDLWSARSFGHTGFTGTSLWVDREYDLWAVLLTNAVHMGRQRGGPAVQRLRSAFHNALLGAMAD